MAYGAARAKCDQVMFEALAKAAEIVLLNRIHESRELGRRVGRTRFNIDIDEVDVLRGMMEYWRRDLHLPLRILIVWRPAEKSEKRRLLERWDLHFAPSERPLSGAEDEKELLAEVRSLWKRLVLLLRTLYSRSLLMPATRLAREADHARRVGRPSGSLGFAVCTREADSDAWLLLNGHDSAAYQPNPPLEFADARVSKLALPVAECAFGTYSIGASYEAPPRADLGAQVAEQQVEEAAKLPPPDMQRTPSALSILLSASSPKHSDDEDLDASKLDGGPLFFDNGASSTEDIVLPPPALKPPAANKHQRAEGRNDGDDDDDDDDDDRVAKTAKNDDVHHHHLLEGPLVQRARTAPLESDDTKDAATKWILRENEPRTSAGPAAVRSPPGSSLDAPSSKRPAHLAASAVGMPQQLPLGVRQVSRSAEDRNGGERLMMEHLAAKADKPPHFAAPFGYAADDDDDDEGGSSGSSRHRRLPSPLMFAKRPIPAVPPRRAPASEPAARATPTKPPVVNSSAVVSSATSRRREDLFAAYSPSSPADDDLKRLQPPPFASFVPGSSSPDGFELPKSILSSSPPFVSAARFARRLSGSSPTSPLDRAQYLDSHSTSRGVDAQAFFSDDDDDDDDQNDDQNDDYQNDRKDDRGDASRPGASSSRSRGLPSARGALPLAKDSSPFVRPKTLDIVDPFDDDGLVGLPARVGGPLCASLLAQSVDSDEDEPLPKYDPPPFAFDDDDVPEHDEDLGATVVEAVAEIVHVAKDPPPLTLAKEPPLSLQQLELDLKRCRDYGLADRPPRHDDARPTTAETPVKTPPKDPRADDHRRARPTAAMSAYDSPDHSHPHDHRHKPPRRLGSY
ncbi:hypothetical protein CTAYLR_001191 [Chrysophaeum taylorii]|uniref:Autophagy-related protein 13 N-terminal domain-containing protein n=1 Tax=Chrysophaeum taylorii TaxID=2483200 RepID=A0AAD7UCJ6_9STRA|nr:hypothetical protein CTAYLR_001191 [Chrysophaeum taylorii]